MIGQAVLVYDARGGFAISTITDETKASWRVKGNLYDKASLRLRGGGAWTSSRIEVATDEMVEAAKKKLRRLRLIAEAKKIKFDLLTERQLENIIEMGKLL